MKDIFCRNGPQSIFFTDILLIRSSRPEVFCKKVFLEISQNSQAGLQTLLKKRLWYSCFPVNFAKFLKTTFLTEHLGGCF